MHIGYDVRPTRTPFTPNVVSCPCPLNGPRGGLKFAIMMRYQENVASAIHLCNVRDLSFVKFAINVPLLLDIQMVDAPEIFQINKIPILDVVGNVSVRGAANISHSA